MTDTVYARSVRHNLATLMTYVDTVEHFQKRHAAELREALNEALSLAVALRMSGVRVLLVMAMGVFHPVTAIRQVHRFLEKAAH